MPWTKLQTGLLEHDAFAPDTECDRWLDYTVAIHEALDTALAIDPSVFILGQDVDAPTAMFGTTRDFHTKYGPDRCIDTPLAEAGMTGVAIGAAMGGMRPVYMHNRPDFFFLCMDQLINSASKWHFMFNGAMSVPMVIWACIGRGWGSGAQHSQTLEGVFMQFPGLKFVMPSSAYDAKGLMLSAIADPNPVMIVEHRHNFKYKGRVPEEPYTVPIGRGIVRRHGADITVVAISQMVVQAQQAADLLAEEGIEVEVVDLRSLRPLDEDIVINSVRKTGRLVVADTGWKRGGFSAEIMAIAMEHALDVMKGPARRVTSPDCPTPSGYTLEDAFYADKDDIVEAVRAVMKESS